MHKINYHNRSFKLVQNEGPAETSSDTIFRYTQKGNVLECSYRSEGIIIGHLLGLVDANGNIEMRYHQINKIGQLKTGICLSKPEIMDSGKLRLHESWEWTCGNYEKGSSVLEEI